MVGFFNVIWFVLFGWWNALVFFILSIVFAATIIGFPIAKSLFQFAKLNAVPFGKEVIKETDLSGSSNISPIRKIGGIIANIIWFPIGFTLMLVFLIEGAVSFLTVIGIPVGVVYVRMGKFLLFPIGAKVVSKDRI